MIVVLDSRGCRTGYVSPSRAAFEVARGRAQWCHHPAFPPDLRKGTIQRFQVTPLPADEPSQAVLLLDVHGVPLAATLPPPVARALLDHPERWLAGASGPVVEVVGHLRAGRWPRCLRLTRALSPAQLQALLEAGTAAVVDHAARLRELLELLHRALGSGYASCDLAPPQLEAILRTIQGVGYLAGEDAPVADLERLQDGLTDAALASWGDDDTMRQIYARAVLLSRLAAHPHPVVTGLAGLRPDLAAMTEAEAAAVVAQADPLLHAVWREATHPRGATGGRQPGPPRRPSGSGRPVARPLEPRSSPVS